MSGSVWQGRAEQVAVAAVPLGALEWTLDKAPLLGGTLHGRPPDRQRARSTAR